MRTGQEWLKKQHEGGLSGGEFCRNRSALIDGVLRRLWKRAAGFQNGRASNPGISLIAIGGYGREELNPFSDIDLLLLHLPGKGKDLSEWVQALLHPLWDWGLTVGYTVQTPKEASGRPAGTWTSSFLPGCALGGRGQGAVPASGKRISPGNVRKGKEKEMILQIQQRALDRHKKAGDSVFVLEPEIKEGKGGSAGLSLGALGGENQTPGPIPPGNRRTRAPFRAGVGKLLPSSLDSLDRCATSSTFPTGEGKTASPSRTRKAWPGRSGIRGRIPCRHGIFSEGLLPSGPADSPSVLEYPGKMPGRGPRLLRNSWGAGRPPEIAPGFYLYHGRLALTDPSHFDRNPFRLWQAFEIVHRHGMEAGCGP